MSVSMEAFLYDENADDRPLEQARVASVEDSARVRRERAWKAMYPNEWAEWVRLRPLMDPVIDFWAGREFDFSDFLKKVGVSRLLLTVSSAGTRDFRTGRATSAGVAKRRRRARPRT